MKSQEKEQGKKCFIITPIGDNGSETFRMAKGVIESVIKPLLENYGYDDVKPVYEINESGMITTQIINRIIDDDLVICNLTGNNPNVMYELCLRHVVAKPIIHICQNGTTLPFDIKDNRTIFYKNDMLGVQELKNQMEDFLKEIDYSKEYKDNPVYNARRMSNLLKDIPAGSDKQVEIELLQNVLQKIELLNMPNFNENTNKNILSFCIYMDENITKDVKENIKDELKVLLKMNSYNYKIINNVFFCKIERSNLSNHRKNITSIVESVYHQYNEKIYTIFL